MVSMKALVTGGSRGIGYAIAKRLLLDGHDVLIIGRSKENLDKARLSLQSFSSRPVLSCYCDISNIEEIRKTRSYADSEGFAPNILVLNAGIFLEGNISDGERKHFIKTLEVNLIAQFDFVQIYLDVLNTQPYPRIFLIGSTASLEPYAFGPMYGIAKYGVRGLAINLRNELKSSGVGVTLVTPGGTLTDLWAGEDLPPKRLLEPDDIARLISCSLTLSEQAVVEEIVVRPMLGDMHE
jgi:short-subunit dehydrogenase